MSESGQSSAASRAQLDALRRRFDEAGQRHEQCEIVRGVENGQVTVEMAASASHEALRDFGTLARATEQALRDAGLWDAHATEQAKRLSWAFQLAGKTFHWAQANGTSQGRVLDWALKRSAPLGETERVADNVFHVIATALELFLAEQAPVAHPTPQDQPQAPEPSRWPKPHKPTSAAEREMWVQEYLDQFPLATIRDVALAIRTSRGSVANTQAWRTYQTEKSAHLPAKARGQVKTVNVENIALASDDPIRVSDNPPKTPGHRFSERYEPREQRHLQFRGAYTDDEGTEVVPTEIDESIEQFCLSRLSEQERAEYFAMPTARRAALLQLVKEQKKERDRERRQEQKRQAEKDWTRPKDRR